MAAKAPLAALLVLIIGESPARAQLSLGEIASAPSGQVAASSIFQFGRTRYFRALVESQRCSTLYPQRAAANESRFRTIVERMTSRFGSVLFDIDKPVAAPPGGSWGQRCDAATLASYEIKIGELAAWADRADALNVQPPGL